eukprot:TRINITY_DN13292_c0_g2_i2.p1 TRINITY_DN13292_c0_g2~~TRINITY_DN13292_c0_g2_i2.p1  ORF type:complete len:510 (+),score=200.23 TRINITY_DN13292_c0_g2_i2:58-1587(+)
MGGCGSKVHHVDNEEGLLSVPPDAVGAINAAWVTQELAKGGEHIDLQSIKVEQLTAANIDNVQRQDGGGISGSRILRLRLTYKDGGRKLSNGKDSLVMKWTNFEKVPPMPINLRIAQVVLFKVNQADLYRTEHYFLSKVGSKDIHQWGVQTPATYATAAQDASEPAACCRLACDSRSKLITSCVMEDIGEYKTPAQPFGNVPLGKAKGALRNVARLHRATWGRFQKYTDDLNAIYGRNGCATSHIGLYGLQGSGVFPKKMKFDSSSGPNGFHKTWGLKNSKPGDDRGLNSIKKIASDGVIINGLKNLQKNWATILPGLGSIEPQCCVHGDFHHWNNMFSKTDENDVMLIDWQYFGAGRVPYELLYFFNGGIEPKSMLDDIELLQTYHAALVDPSLPFPPIDYPLERFLSDWRHAIVDNVVTLCISMGTPTMGISYTPSDYKGMAKDPKQRDFVVGGMVLSDRAFTRFKHMYEAYGTFDNGLSTAPVDRAPTSPVLGFSLASAPEDKYTK